MNSQELVQSFAEFKQELDIDRATLVEILEGVFRAVLTRQYGSADNFDVIINVDKGDFEIWRNREVVEDGAVEDPNRQVGLSEAKRMQEDLEVGEELSDEVIFEEFARRNILAIRQNLSARFSEFKKRKIREHYEARIGELISAEVNQVHKREAILLDEEHHELVLPKDQQIPSDFFRKGDSVRAVVEEVREGNRGPVVILSRTSPKFLERLLELEVPEIFDGLITIKRVVRIPGTRAKVAVESYDDRIDPVGACVGMGGSRIHGIVRELRNENIDVVNYTTNDKLYIQRALKLARNFSVTLDEEHRRAEVTLRGDEMSFAIGKGGSNINLASQLTGYSIDVYNEDENGALVDYSLDEFNDEIEQWVLDSLKRMGCDTARAVLDKSPEFVAQQADLELETVQEVMRVLRAEFEQ